jgi:GlpG protein
MRLIAEFDNEKKAYAFFQLLQQKKIEISVEPFEEKSSGKKGIKVWVLDEDHVPVAEEFYEKFKKDPKVASNLPFEPLDRRDVEEENFLTEDKGKVVKLAIKKKVLPVSFALTYFFLFLCVSLFIVNLSERSAVEKSKGEIAAQVLLTPLQKELMFDYTQSMAFFENSIDELPDIDQENVDVLSQEVEKIYVESLRIPSWKGFYQYFLNDKKNEDRHLWSHHLFEKISQGEVWRLFSPCLLHSDFLHILFNMAWLWLLGRQIEIRIKTVKFLTFIVIVGVISNVMQYLMSGPLFLGFSGVVVGMAGFIWSRQHRAPWEGYPLQKSTMLFVVFFVVIMFLLEIVSFFLHYFSLYNLSPNIANTAHVVGGVVGYLLGKMRFFARGAVS